jgi:hypothetical protein
MMRADITASKLSSWWELIYFGLLFISWPSMHNTDKHKTIISAINRTFSSKRAVWDGGFNVSSMSPLLTDDG